MGSGVADGGMTLLVWGAVAYVLVAAGFGTALRVDHQLPTARAVVAAVFWAPLLLFGVGAAIARRF